MKWTGGRASGRLRDAPGRAMRAEGYSVEQAAALLGTDAATLRGRIARAGMITFGWKYCALGGRERVLSRVDIVRLAALGALVVEYRPKRWVSYAEATKLVEGVLLSWARRGVTWGDLVRS